MKNRIKLIGSKMFPLLIITLVAVIGFTVIGCPGGGGGSGDTVTIAAITGVTAPVTGATPVTAITDTAQYTGTVTWSPTVTTTFAASTDYTATITLAAKEGFTFDGVAANFFTVAGATSTANAVDSGTVTAVFPKTGAVAGINIDVGNIADGTPVITGDIIISRSGTGADKTKTVTVDNPTSYTSIAWEVAGAGVIYTGAAVTGTGATFTLDAEDSRYNVIGQNTLILTVVKDGQQFQKVIPFEIKS